MQVFIKIKWFYGIALTLCLVAISYLFLKNSEADETPLTSIQNSEIRPLNKSPRSQKASTFETQPNTVDAEHDVEYDLSNALSVFENRVNQEDHNLSNEELQLLTQLMGNLNEFENRETNQ